MWLKLKKHFHWIQSKLPEYRLRTEYFEMLQKLKRLENQVERNAQQLEMAKSSFLKNLYHEIRTPLNAIIGFTNIVAKDSDMHPEEREEYLSHINKSSSDFLRIMDDIIQASLLEAGMINISKDKFDLHHFFNDTHIYFTTRKHLLEKNSIALLKNVPTDISELLITCDRQKLFQILSHLIENALKFTEKGIIEYGYVIKDKKIEFYVKDTGIGNLDGKRNYLFTNFSKLDITENSRNGLGLGLFISKKLVELLDGKIWYSSNETRGTCFYFNIPFVSAETNINKGKENYIQSALKGQDYLAV
jgi:signal transduction histidine kinase